MKKLFNVGIGLLVLLAAVSVVSAVAPDVPGMPSGPGEGGIGELLSFEVTGVAADNDVFYLFDWGDGLNTGWIGPFAAGENETVDAKHKFMDFGSYDVRVKAKDSVTDEESAFSEALVVNITGAGDAFTIGSVSGGFGVSAQIINDLAPSKYVDYTIEIAGGQLTGFHVYKKFEGTVFVESGGSAMISTGAFFSLGNVKVTVSAVCAGEEVAEKVVFGRALFIYFLL